MSIINGKLIEENEPRFSLDEDSICYGCEYYIGEDECDCLMFCVEGIMNNYIKEESK